MSASGRDRRGRLVRIGEERHRLAQPAQDHVARAGQRLHRRVDDVGHAIDRHAAAAARDAGVRALRDQPRAGRRGDAVRELQRLGAHRLAAEHDQRGHAAAQDLGSLRDLRRVGRRLRRHRQRVGDDAALVPRRVGRQDQRGDLAGMGARGLHRDGGIGAHGGRRRGGAHPGGDAARPALGVGGQRRIVRAVIGRLVADDVDDGRWARRALCRLARPFARPGPQCSSVAAGLPAMRA